MPATPLANWNGEIMPLEEVKVSVLDRAFLFGDAIYEVIRVYHGKPFLFTDHINRLGRNIEKLQLRADVRVIEDRVLELLERQPLQDAIVYIQITRGQAKRTHHYPPENTPTNQLVYVAEFNDPYLKLRQDGISTIIVDDFRWGRCDIKSVNLLANCMAAQAAKEAGCEEALFADSKGALIEGTHTSLFGVKEGAILTAPLGNQVLPGITRKLLMELTAQSRIPVIETSLHRNDLAGIDELFLTGTTVEILPVVRVDDQSVGHGIPGPVVKKLLLAYTDKIKSFGHSK